MSKIIDVNMKYDDSDYSDEYVQNTKVNEKDTKLILEGLDNTPEDKKKADALMQSACDWIFNNSQEIKKFMAKEFDIRLEGMRKRNEKNVPVDDEKSILKKLEDSSLTSIDYTYRQDDTDVIIAYFPITFNDISYLTKVMIRDTQCVSAYILNQGKFKPSPYAEKPDLSSAASLYKYHIDNGSEKNLYQSYIALSKKEIENFVDLWINDETSKPDDRIDLMLYLALFSYQCGDKLPDRLYDYLLKEEIFYYGELYLRAPEKYAKELFSKLGEVDDPKAYTLVVDHILSAISRIPSQEVNDFLIENSKKPLPIWAQELHILPVKYARTVGCWEAIKNGKPKMLFNSEIIPLSRVEKKNTDEIAPLKAIPAKCEFCGQPLTLIYNNGIPQATCLNCSCYQTIYTKIKDKKIIWHPKNKIGEFFKKYPENMKCDENILDSIKYGLAPTKENRKPSYTANQFANISYTQLGGLPTAINDIDIPICPDCGKPMKFVGQLDMAELQDYGEGIYYFFECEDCQTTAANYSQS